jgi:putative FmdB family regulatory protein
MPTYEHRCEACGHEWELKYKISEDPPDTCPECGVVGKTKRLISGPTPGRVELYGRERVMALRKEGKEMAKEMRKSDSKMADFYGK